MSVHSTKNKSTIPNITTNNYNNIGSFLLMKWRQLTSYSQQWQYKLPNRYYWQNSDTLITKCSGHHFVQSIQASCEGKACHCCCVSLCSPLFEHFHCLVHSCLVHSWYSLKWTPCKSLLFVLSTLVQQTTATSSVKDFFLCHLQSWHQGSPKQNHLEHIQWTLGRKTVLYTDWLSRMLPWQQDDTNIVQTG